MAQEIHQLANVITCHAFNADRTKVALCPNNNEIHIYSRQEGQWARETILKEHDQTVLGLDWAPKTDRIVSCSQDRNAYVWQFSDGAWRPTLVILRINRAATCVKWSPQENKFAVASGSKVVPVCHFEEEGNWWISKHIKKHRSTVLTVDWHPNNVLLATGGADFRCRVFSAFVKDVDADSAQSQVLTSSGKANVFGELLAEFDQVQGWVHAVQWSPSGRQLAFTGHDARFAVADVSKEPPSVEVVKLSLLPFRSLLWTEEGTVVAVGHDPSPQVLQRAQGRWAPVSRLDRAEDKAAARTDAKSKFQALEKVGQESRDASLATKHQNCVVCVTGYEGQRGAWTRVATTGIDGKLIVWAVK